MAVESTHLVRKMFEELAVLVFLLLFSNLLLLLELAPGEGTLNSICCQSQNDFQNINFDFFLVFVLVLTKFLKALRKTSH